MVLDWRLNRKKKNQKKKREVRFEKWKRRRDRKNRGDLNFIKYHLDLISPEPDF